MPLSRKKLFLLFLFQIFLTFETNTFFPSLKICFFIPFLAFSLYNLSFIKLLWISFASGLVFDALSSQYVLGAYSLSFTMTSLACYRLKKIFYQEKKITFFIVTLLFSIVNTSMITLLFSDISLKNLTWKWLATDLLIYPVIEGISAFLIYTLPPIALRSFKLLKKSPDHTVYTGKRPR